MSRVAALVLLAAVARAEPTPEVAAEQGPAMPRNAVSFSITSLLAGTYAAQYERLLHPRASALVGLSFRTLAGGDFRSLHLAAGVEGRVWILTRSPWSPLRACAVGGPYVGLRADVSRTEVSAGSGATSASWGVAGTLTSGYRLPIACRVEVTPHVGAGGHVDAGGHVGVQVRGVVSAGATLGVLF